MATKKTTTKKAAPKTSTAKSHSKLTKADAGKNTTETAKKATPKKK